MKSISRQLPTKKTRFSISVASRSFDPLPVGVSVFPLPRKIRGAAEIKKEQTRKARIEPGSLASETGALAT